MLKINKIFLFVLLFGGLRFVFGQNAETSGPVFLNCEGQLPKEKGYCFDKQIQQLMLHNFVMPSFLVEKKYKGTLSVRFEVDENGKFAVQFVDSFYPELVAETKRVFGLLPVITPAKYQGKSVYSKYVLRMNLPLNKDSFEVNEIESPNKMLAELDSLKTKSYKYTAYKSYLNIPFSHSFYAKFDAKINQMGANNHTASKPFSYEEVSRYYDFEKERQQLSKHKEGWWGRKFWDEHMIAVEGENYWFTLDPVADLQIGKASDLSGNTYLNTRAVNFRGGIGKSVFFSTTVFESQGLFANYFNQYARSIKPSGGNPAIIPGMGISKGFGSNAFDFPLAEANLTFQPSKMIQAQLGYGRNFIGDGYRSLLESDASSVYPFFKLNTTFWKLKYTNTYALLKDVRAENVAERTYATKFMANHYLSWNVSNRLNLGFFESVIWSNTNNRGFDMSFVNPIIFYRSVEFAASSKTGNALLGLTGKYKFSNKINAYGQYLLDEFSLSDMKAGQGSWKNKFAYQLGLKYYDAFGVPNLYMQMEYNQVRPYVYSHSSSITNYGHNNQSIGHNWGSNFKEFILIGRYNEGRVFGDAKMIYGIRGFDFDTAEDSKNYGSDIYKSYDVNRATNTGVHPGQGNKVNYFNIELQGGYLINPVTNLKLYAQYIYRNFDPTMQTAQTEKGQTSWFVLGFRTDIFNWYFDY